jgi:hypothetical protein
MIATASDTGGVQVLGDLFLARLTACCTACSTLDSPTTTSAACPASITSSAVPRLRSRPARAGYRPRVLPTMPASQPLRIVQMG